jgi:hypothetical protein
MPIMAAKMSPPPAERVSVQPSSGSFKALITIEGREMSSLSFPCFFYKVLSASDLVKV